MSIRTKGRNKFTHSDRSFVWWIENDTFLRIASEDKQFVVAYVIYDTPSDVGGILVVHGRKFPGLESDRERPIHLEVPRSIAHRFRQSVGAVVEAVITWSLDENHDIIRYTRNEPTFLGNHTAN